ncbi:MAG: OmpH family outer membrane protein [Gemmataceae bacterium]|nr:OmpH family outer membrane protein [Gemmataceae bacterium]MCS7269630.1 OmpH family outer membrane protein [Gemmataceae bacterium]MDW8243707.1 OmpH family outer membrane protein [Thermogemmata sp.]
MSRFIRPLTACSVMLGLIGLIGPARGQNPATPPTQPPQRPAIAVFNMAAVMRDYGKAKYQVYLLNKKREELSKDIIVWRSELAKLQQEYQQQQVTELRDKLGKQMVELSRKIQDREAEVNRILNDEASAIISQLYDEIKTVVDKTAEMNGYHIVFAYPDAVTAEEMKNPMIKELKLKPPAAQPFYVARHVDLTPVLIQTLNAWYPPKDAQGNVVDVSKLPPLGGAVTPTGGTAPAAPPSGQR